MNTQDNSPGCGNATRLEAGGKKMGMDEKEKFLSFLPGDGSPIGNMSLRAALHLEQGMYERIKKELLAEGTIKSGAGRGGSVMLANPNAPPAKSVRQESSEDEIRRLIGDVPADGSAIGNISLRKKLGWGESKYWKIRNAAYAQGRIAIGGGMGGSVLLPETRETVKIAGGKGGVVKAAEKYPDEPSLYAPLLTVINTTFSKERLLLDDGQFITAQTARRAGGKSKKDRNYGTWTVPDFTLVACRKYSFIPGAVLDVITLEIKHHSMFNATAVYEAAAHRRFSNKSFLGVYVPQKLDAFITDSNEDFQRILSECSRLGVGFFHFSDPEDYATFEFKVDALRRIPDPWDQDHFIRTTVSAEYHDTIRLLAK